jgi:hypothetical protein
MRRSILTTLGVLAAIAGLASSVDAQPTVASNSRNGASTGEFTLSGNSLVGIRNRTVGNDFNRFFLDNSSTTAPSNTGTALNSIDSNSIGSNNNLTIQDPGVLQISDNVQVVSNEPIYHPSTRVPGEQHLPFTNIERAQVQLNQ